MLIIFFTIQNEQLFTDELTGLNNRKSLNHYIEKKFKNPAFRFPVTALLISVKDFRELSRIHGIGYGDTLLEQTGELLKETLLGKFFVVRLGSDFIILMENIEEKKLSNIIHLLEDNLKEHNRRNAFSQVLNLKISYEIFPSKDIRISEFYARLYRKK